MMKIQCMLDKQLFKKKPSGFEIGGIQKRISQTEIEIEDLAELLKQGATFKPALLNGSKSVSWQSQQLFGLDFDEGTTIKEELEKCNKLNIFPCFGYTTFSYTEEKQKFRLVFCTDEIITDINIRNKLQITLIKTFNKSDEVTKDSTRLFFGGKSLICEKYDNRIYLLSSYLANRDQVHGGTISSVMHYLIERLKMYYKDKAEKLYVYECRPVNDDIHIDPAFSSGVFVKENIVKFKLIKIVKNNFFHKN